MKKLFKKIQFCFRDFFINRRARKKLKIDDDITILSSDCTAGCIYKDLKLKFCSPTINCYFEASDFIKFLQNLRLYLYGEFVDRSDSLHSYPLVGIKINDGKEEILLHCLHYKSAEEFIDKWIERRERINYDNVFVIMNDRNNFNKQILKQFDELTEYKNKVCFVHLPNKFESAFYLPGSENDSFVKPVMNYKHAFGVARYYDAFNFVDWFNNRES